MAIYTVGGKAPSKKVIESIKVKYFSPISSSFDALSKQLSTHPSFRNFKEFRWKNQIQRIIPHEGLETIREEDNINASLSKNIDGDQIKDLIEHRAAWASNLAGFQEGFKLNSEDKKYISNVYDTLLKNHPNTDLKITRIMVGFKGKEKGAIVLVGRLGTKQQSIKDDKAVIISLHPGANDSVVSYHNFLENLDPEYKKKGQVITFVPEPGTGKEKLTKDELYNIHADTVEERNSLAAKNKEFENKLKNTIDELVKHRNDAFSYKSSLESVQEEYKKLQKKNEEADVAYKRLEDKFDAHKEDTVEVLKRIKRELEHGNALGRRKKGINYAKQITGELIERLKK